MKEPIGELDHWDYAISFTSTQAAYLIMGLDPSLNNVNDAHRAMHIINRMKDAYESALASYSYDLYGFYPNHPKMQREQEKSELVSKSMKEILEKCRKINDSKILVEWMFSISSDFETQQFLRNELHRWIKTNSFPSQYIFVKSQEINSSTDKPLTNRERKTLLAVIAVLCKEAKLEYITAAKTAGLIHDAASRMGISIGESTIENHLKRIPDALESRLK